jgi:hypothetical protein
MSVEITPQPNVNGRNDRFTYAKVLEGERQLFLKKAISPELEPNLQRELLWADFMNYIAKIEPEVHIRGPEIIGFDEDGGLLMEYIDAPQVASPSDGAGWKEKIDRYAYTLAALDRYAEDYTVQWPTNGMATIDNIDKVWRRWFGERYESNRTVLSKAHGLIVSNEDNITYRLQHGDLTPWQMFEQGEDWIIFDGEKAGDHLPRFNDLAYAYGRLFTRLKDSETASKMLEKFIEYSGIDRDTFFKDFLPVMAFRATGMLADAYNDNEREDYVEQANGLLELCFKGQLDGFLPKH